MSRRRKRRPPAWASPVSGPTATAERDLVGAAGELARRARACRRRRSTCRAGRRRAPRPPRARSRASPVRSEPRPMVSASLRRPSTAGCDDRLEQDAESVDADSHRRVCWSRLGSSGVALVTAHSAGAPWLAARLATAGIRYPCSWQSEPGTSSVRASQYPLPYDARMKAATTSRFHSEISAASRQRSARRRSMSSSSRSMRVGAFGMFEGRNAIGRHRRSGYRRPWDDSLRPRPRSRRATRRRRRSSGCSSAAARPARSTSSRASGWTIRWRSGLARPHGHTTSRSPCTRRCSRSPATRTSGRRSRRSARSTAPRGSRRPRAPRSSSSTPGFWLGRDRAQTLDDVVDWLHAPRAPREEGAGGAVRHRGDGPRQRARLARRLLEIAARLDWLRPVIDFAHMHATSDGAFLDTDAFASALERADAVIEPGAPFHIHFSDIAYANRNETKHLPYGDGTLRAEPLRDALARFERPATVISESPDEASSKAIRRRSTRAGAGRSPRALPRTPAPRGRGRGRAGTGDRRMTSSRRISCIGCRDDLERLAQQRLRLLVSPLRRPHDAESHARRGLRGFVVRPHGPRASSAQRSASSTCRATSSCARARCVSQSAPRSSIGVRMRIASRKRRSAAARSPLSQLDPAERFSPRACAHRRPTRRTAPGLEERRLGHVEPPARRSIAPARRAPAARRDVAALLGELECPAASLAASTSSRASAELASSSRGARLEVDAPGLAGDRQRLEIAIVVVQLAVPPADARAAGSASNRLRLASSSTRAPARRARGRAAGRRRGAARRRPAQ